MMDEQTKRCRGKISGHYWEVRSDNGVLSISSYDVRFTRPKLPAALAKRIDQNAYDVRWRALDQLKRDAFELRGTYAIHRANNGWLLGADIGEFGGGIWWIPDQGHPEFLYPRQTRHFFNWKGLLHAAGGLAHLGLDSGFVVEIRRENEGWATGNEIRLPSDVAAIQVLHDKRLLVVTYDMPVIITLEGQVMPQNRAGSNWAWMAPNSIAQLKANRLAVGMRFAVAELHLKQGKIHETGWLLPKTCVRLEPVPGFENRQCRCVPASG